MARKTDMTAARLHNGAVVVSTVINGYRESKTYYGYSISEAMAAFAEEFYDLSDEQETNYYRDVCGSLSKR